MKKEHFIIASFLICVALALFLVLNRRFHFAAMLSQALLEREILSDAYVRDTILSSDGSTDEHADSYVFNNVEGRIPPLSTSYVANSYDAPSFVLGASTGPKKIIVDLSHQRVYAYDGNRLALNFLVSTGKWGATPLGSYKIWYKVRSQTMKGGNQALGTYYYLPNVQFIQYFNKGIGFHSTYWHNNFGSPMSHGCVNMTLTDSETLYHWATPSMPSGVKIFRASDENPGTAVEVVDSWTI
jgi:lipoprotein-anchoring transpeptidase ErfK/SrfK